MFGSIGEWLLHPSRRAFVRWVCVIYFWSICTSIFLWDDEFGLRPDTTWTETSLLWYLWTSLLPSFVKESFILSIPALIIFFIPAGYGFLCSLGAVMAAHRAFDQLPSLNYLFIVTRHFNNDGINEDENKE